MKLILLAAATMMTAAATAQSRWGAAAYANPGSEMALDGYVSKWLKKRATFSAGAELLYSPLPADSDAFARDYNYPTFAVGLRYCNNSRVRMHRDPDPDWGLAEEVDYDSRLGDTWSVYLKFARPFFRTRRWMAEYALATGVGYSTTKYNKTDAIDNELIGSHLNIYFAAGLYLTYQVAADYALRAGIDYYHHSNGALARPNKGANVLGPSIGVVWFPDYADARIKSKTDSLAQTWRPFRFQPRLTANVALNVGGKTMLEDWQITQFGTPSSDPDYRTEQFKFYMAYSLRADMMYRYARRWASGIGVDLFYGSYAGHIRDIDEAAGEQLAHSPWSVGIALKHQVYYHRLSLAMSIGYYLYRHMGASAKLIEKPYYETIGLRYTFPKWGGLQLGLEVNAHKTKADYTSAVVSFPIWGKEISRRNR